MTSTTAETIRTRLPGAAHHSDETYAIDQGQALDASSWRAEHR